jgi:hypothetical protein
LDRVAPGHVKELKRLINFVAQAKDKGLKMRFSGGKPWEIEGYSDSDFAGDKNGRKSVTGMIILISGVPISWNSKGQGTVTLSSTEAEYVALCDVVREVKFITQILSSLNIEFKRPINVFVDNISVIFLTENRNLGEKITIFANKLMTDSSR